MGQFISFTILRLFRRAPWPRLRVTGLVFLLPLITALMPVSETLTMNHPAHPGRKNRLAAEKSPYLLQHASNPVDWYPWGEEALARARAEDRPIFLSVGYSTCHWCHVMERESFEREDIAALLNDGFVAIKVDREERPDIDDIYMKATQLMTGHGGWPNSVWLTPDGRPWYAGTYFPPDDMTHARPGFKTVLARLGEIWTTRRSEVEEQADRLSAAIRDAGTPAASAGGDGVPGREIVLAEVGELTRSFDRVAGGFGGAPKFPPHGALAILLHELSRDGDGAAPRARSAAATPGRDTLLEMTVRTLEAMERGGIHDHVGGGFHRYSTDARWFLPHFEKMLYDNAQLGRAYTDAYALTGRDDFRETAVDLYDWVLREMRDPAGGFYSALDADSEGEEGKFYLWSRREILDVLGKKEGELFARVYDVSEGGNYAEEATGEKKGTNIVYLPRSLAEAAKRERMDEEELRNRLAADRARLLGVRVKRIWPHLDDKVLASWNGLMIGSLAHAGRVLGEPRYVEAARDAADFVMTHMIADGRLLRSWRAGEAHVPGYLDDYAFFAAGLLELGEATGDAARLAAARQLMDTVMTHFRDPLAGAFFFSSDEHEPLLDREKDVFDEAIPSGNGMAAAVLVKLGTASGDQRYRDEAGRALAALRGSMERAPRGTESLLLATAQYQDTEAAPAFTARGAGAASEPIVLASAGTPGLGGTRDQSTDSALIKADSARADSARADSAAADTAIAADRKGVVSAALFAPVLRARPGEKIEISVTLDIEPGWHVNSAKPLEEYLIPTSLTVDDSSGVTVAMVTYPRGSMRRLRASPHPMSIFEGSVTVRASLAIPEKARVGRLPVTVLVDTQPCNDESCIAPETLALPMVIEVKGP